MTEQTISTVEIPSGEVLVELLSGITESMFGLKFEPETSDAFHSEVSSWPGAAVSLAGASPYTLSVAADPEGARELCSVLFSCEPSEVTGTMPQEALRELANILAGQVMNVTGIRMGLGLPEAADAIPPHAQLNRMRRDATMRCGSIGLRVCITSPKPNGGVT